MNQKIGWDVGHEFLVGFVYVCAYRMGRIVWHHDAGVFDQKEEESR